MKCGTLTRCICMLLCLCLLGQMIPVVISATDSGPVITRQPQSATAALNEEVTVSVEAEGENLQYQWYIRNKGSEKFSKSSIKTDTYTVIMNKARAGRELYCVITDAQGNRVETDVVTLTRVASIPLTITCQPQSAAAYAGEEISVFVGVQGEGLKYQWYLRNKGAENFSKSSIKTDTYTTIMNATRAEREVYCVITDALGNTVTSEIVTLHGETKVPLKITRQPQSATADYGEEIRVTLEAHGDDLKYQWYLRNDGAGDFSKSSIKTDTYTVTMNGKRDGRELYCVVTDALGNQVVSDVVTIGKTTEQVVMFCLPPSSTAGVSEAEPESMPVSEPQVEPVTEPVITSAPESDTAPVTEPVIEAHSEYETEPVTEPAYELETEPQAEEESANVAETATEPENEIIDITEKLNALMLKNGEELRRIRKEKGYLYACIYYYVKVTDAGDWDIKRTEDWSFEPGKTYVYQGVEMRMDDPGNIHFGYLGAILFPEEFVCFGAGLNNFMKFGRRDGNFASYFDDPHDQIMMRWGYQMYFNGF